MNLENEKELTRKTLYQDQKDRVSHRAILLMDGQQIAKGIATIPGNMKWGKFEPTEPIQRDIPEHQVILKIEEIPHELYLQRIWLCEPKREHWHFLFQE